MPIRILNLDGFLVEAKSQKGGLKVFGQADDEPDDFFLPETVSVLLEAGGFEKVPQVILSPTANTNLPTALGRSFVVQPSIDGETHIFFSVRRNIWRLDRPLANLIDGALGPSVRYGYQNFSVEKDDRVLGFVGRDGKNPPAHYGLKRLEPETSTWKSITSPISGLSGNALVLLFHGFWSTTEGSFTPSDWKFARDCVVLGFDHDTVASDPTANAEACVDSLINMGLNVRQFESLRLVAYS